MPQCRGCFPLTCPHFLLLAGLWSQGSIHSFGWEGVAHTRFSAMFSQRRRFRHYSCAEKAQDCPRDGAGNLMSGTAGTQSSNIQGQVLLRHKPCKGKKAGDTAVCRGWGGASQTMPHSTFAWLAMFLALLLKNIYQKKGETAGNCSSNLVCKCKAAECRRGKYHLSLPTSF